MSYLDKVEMAKDLINMILPELEIKERINIINELRESIHEHSPFRNEPVDFVKWVTNDKVVANDYNPNKVAPPEMELLEVSIMNDGYTQPIVTYPNEGNYEVVDGFHRNRVGKESIVVNNRVQGYLPLVAIRSSQSSKNDRIASTIRHNRARGKHQVDAMSEIVIELKNRNWSNSRIAKQLGMDEEEVLRLCQISGLEHLFSDNDFSKAWESSDYVEEQYEMLTDEVNETDMEKYKIPNEKDKDRIYHTYHKWECHKFGFYASTFEDKSKEECEIMYRDFLADLPTFEAALKRVIKEWVYSCEHYLTNKSMNRIAWLGQASMCLSTGVPAKFCGGYNLLTDKQKQAADELALVYLNKWLETYERSKIDKEQALNIGKQVELY